MNKGLKMIAAAVITCGMMTVNAMAAPVFHDVPPDHWGQGYITRAAEKGLVSGMGDGTFGVNTTLSTGQFTTMICNLLCKDAVLEQQVRGNTATWWMPYMVTAYDRGYLEQTEVGQSRATTGVWDERIVNGEISRYDMAQIMINVAEKEKWAMPAQEEIQTAQEKIADWAYVPDQYRTAVETAYAKGYLSGMDEVGTFAGDQSMTRTQGAVVICKLLDAREAERVLTFPETEREDRLANGEVAVERNVQILLEQFISNEYGFGDRWQDIRSYTSPMWDNQTTYGGQAFAQYMSDYVFGAMPVGEIEDVQGVRIGDMLVRDTLNEYQIVLWVKNDEIIYISAKDGVIKEGLTTLDQLDRKDKIYTRYLSAPPVPIPSQSGAAALPADKLSNGDSDTEEHVQALIEHFWGEGYGVGDTWNKTGIYTSFSQSRVSGDEAFAYHFSDYIFGAMPVKQLDDLRGLRVGDVLYNGMEREYGVVVWNDHEQIIYMSVRDGEICEGAMLVSELTAEDMAYTRYLKAAEIPGFPEKNTPSIGSQMTEEEVQARIEQFWADGYGIGEGWNEDSQALAEHFAEYVFGGLSKKTLSGFRSLRTGDVIDCKSMGEYLIVIWVYGDDVVYMSAINGVICDGTISMNQLGTEDVAYTWYQY